MKRRFLPFLAAILSLLLPVTAYSQSCADEFAGTSFELKSGYSGICEIDGVRFTDPSSEDLAVSADFEEALRQCKKNTKEQIRLFQNVKLTNIYE